MFTNLSRGFHLFQGHDCSPIVFSYNGQVLSSGAKVDEGKGKETGPKFSAMKHFQAMATRGQTAESDVTELGTIHQNAIT